MKEFRIYKRNLPHYEQPGSVYFITFRTVKGFTLSDLAKDITLTSIQFHTDKKYILHACVIMETHVHIILHPQEKSRGTFYSIAQIMHAIKSYSAIRIQRMLNSKGSIWLDENYDRIIRDKDEYQEKMNYITYNPVKAGLVDEPAEYKWLLIKEPV